MVFAKEAKAGFGNPRQFATEIAFALAQGARRAGSRSRGAGLHQSQARPGHLCRTCCARAFRAGADFGRGGATPQRTRSTSNMSPPIRPGPMHVGHGRGAVFGDALANLLAFAGHAVTREYYINDAGAQVDVLARSAYARYREALGETVTIGEGLYPGDYLKPVGRALADKFGRGASRQARKRMARAGARRGDRGDDGDDPRRSRRAEHPPRGVLLRTQPHERRGGRSRRCADRALARARACLRRPAAAAKGQDARRLGGPRADACSAPRSSATTPIARC